MASGSSSPASNISSEISDSDSSFIEMTDADFQNLKVVLGLPAVAVSEKGDGAVAVSEEQLCIGKKRKGISWGFCEDQGSRNLMEDRHAIIPLFLSMTCNDFGGCTAPQGEYASESSPVHYFAVFDGHGGSQVSGYCAESLHKELKEAWDMTESSTTEWNKRWESALRRAYDTIHKKVCEDETEAGSTAIVVLISPCQIIAANCGDSRAVLCRGSHIIPLTNDHKSSVPELSFTGRSEEDECLIIGSDGLWDVMSTEEVGKLAVELLQQGRQAPAIDHKTPSQYVAECLLKESRWKSSTEDFSVIVVDLNPSTIG